MAFVYLMFGESGKRANTTEEQACFLQMPDLACSIMNASQQVMLLNRITTGPVGGSVMAKENQFFISFSAPLHELTLKIRPFILGL